MTPQGILGSEEEILKRAQRMRRKRGGPSTSSTGGDTLYCADTGAEIPTKKAKSEEEVIMETPIIPVAPVPKSSGSSFSGIPSDFLSQYGVDHGIVPAASQLLFPSAEKRLNSCDPEVLSAQTVGHLLQGLQNELVLTKQLRSLADSQAKANLSLNELQTIISKSKEVKAAKLRAQEERLAQEAEKREREFTQQEEELKKELAEERRLKQEALEENKDLEAEATVFVRA